MHLQVQLQAGFEAIINGIYSVFLCDRTPFQTFQIYFFYPMLRNDNNSKPKTKETNVTEMKRWLQPKMMEDRLSLLETRWGEYKKQNNIII